MRAKNSRDIHAGTSPGCENGAEVLNAIQALIRNLVLKILENCLDSIRIVERSLCSCMMQMELSSVQKSEWEAPESKASEICRLEERVQEADAFSEALCIDCALVDELPEEPLSLNSRSKRQWHKEVLWSMVSLRWRFILQRTMESCVLLSSRTVVEESYRCCRDSCK